MPRGADLRAGQAQAPRKGGRGGEEALMSENTTSWEQSLAAGISSGCFGGGKVARPSVLRCGGGSGPALPLREPPPSSAPSDGLRVDPAPAEITIEE